MALQYVFLILCMTIAMLIRSMAFSMTLGNVFDHGGGTGCLYGDFCGDKEIV